jgi:hypothetical protein
MYLLSNSTTCLCSLNCTFAQVIVHSSIVIVSSGFRKLATCITWTALNGTVGGQRRFDCILQIRPGLTQFNPVPVLNQFSWGGPSLFWDGTRSTLAVGYRRFGTTYLRRPRILLGPGAHPHFFHWKGVGADPEAIYNLTFKTVIK